MESRTIKSAALYIKVSTEQQKDGDSLRADTAEEEARLKKLLKIDFDGAYKQLLPSEKRNFWRAIVKEIIFHPDKSLDIIFL